LAQLVDETHGGLGRRAALALAAGLALAWRAHALAQSTHDVLQQILENQTKAQAGKSGKRR
jgi:hypothetical protein